MMINKRAQDKKSAVVYRIAAWNDQINMQGLLWGLLSLFARRLLADYSMGKQHFTAT